MLACAVPQLSIENHRTGENGVGLIHNFLSSLIQQRLGGRQEGVLLSRMKVRQEVQGERNWNVEQTIGECGHVREHAGEKRKM
jgi:hypothetical protein